MTAARGTTADDFTGTALLTGLGGMDTFAGGNGTNVIVETRSSSTNHSFNLGSSALTIDSEGADSFTGIDEVRLTGADMQDDFTVATAFAGTAVIDGASGSTDSVTVNGDSGMDTFTLTTSGVTEGSLSVSYSNTETVNVNGLGGTDQFTAQQNSYSAGAINLDGGAADDTFNVKPATATTIDVDGGAGGGDTLNLDLSGLSSVLSKGKVASVGKADVTFNKVENIVITPANFNIANLPTALLDGLEAFSNLGQALESEGSLGAALPGLADNTVTTPGVGVPPIVGGDVSLGKALGIGEALDRFREQVVTYMADPTPTVSELVTFLNLPANNTRTNVTADAPATSGDLALDPLDLLDIGTVTRSVTWEDDGTGLAAPVITLGIADLRAERTTLFDLDLSEDADLLGVVVDPNEARDIVAYDAAMDLDFAIGLEVAGAASQGALPADFFASVNSLSVDGSVRERDLDFGVNWGFLGADVDPLTITDNVSVSSPMASTIDVTFQNDLGQQPIADLIGHNSSNLDGTISVATQTPGVNGTTDAVQRLDFTGISSGDFTLSYRGESTGPISFTSNMTTLASRIQTALLRLTTINLYQVALDAGSSAALADPNSNGRLGESDLSGRVEVAQAVMSSNNSQVITLVNAPAGGTFTLSFEGAVSAPISSTASSSNIQDALNALPTVLALGGVTVTGSGPFTATFPMMATVNELFTADATGLAALSNVSAVTPGATVFFHPFPHRRSARHRKHFQRRLVYGTHQSELCADDRRCLHRHTHDAIRQPRCAGGFLGGAQQRRLGHARRTSRHPEQLGG